MTIDSKDLRPQLTQLTQASIDHLIYRVIGAAIEVQRHMKAGMKEKVYEDCMALELNAREIPFRKQVGFTPVYKGVPLNCNSRLDLLVDDILVVELKATSEILPVHKAQALNYINQLKLPKALLLNFNTANIVTDGRYTVVNEMYGKLP